jgi:hypothetical protein
MNPSPEQVEKWRKEFVDFGWSAYLRVKTEQATEQATEIAELMPLVKFGARVMRDFSALTVTKINNHALSQDLIGNGSEVKPSIEATITKLLKD